jgi:hypothetical protein
LRDLFEAHYAEEAAAILQFARRHGIDFLVVDDRHFAPEFLRKGAFFAPFDAAIRGATEGRRRFAALRDDLGPTTKIDAHVRIIDLRIAGKPGKTRAP